jgi:teichuronic acid biosynthesis glycosyltransferase TuaC
VTPRVLVVSNMWPTPEDPSFGVFVRDQVAALRTAGASCDVLFLDGRSSSLAYLWGVQALRRRLADGSYDLVHAHHALSGLAVWMAGLGGSRLPWLLSHHGIEVFEGWQAPLARWLTGRADRTLVVSEAMARRLGLHPTDVMPMGVDLRLFSPGRRLASRRELGLPCDRALVAWIGADRPEKRLTLARQAVDALADDGVPADLVVVSGRPHQEVPRWLAAADALLLTSAREGAPVVVKEALACNRPVVSTDVGDVGALLCGLEGCAVTDATPQALAAGLRRALSVPRPQTRQAVEGFDLALLAARLLDVYRELVASAGKPPGQTAGAQSPR